MGFINRIGGSGASLSAMRAAVKAIGPKLFLDADLISGADGDAIGTWYDDSGNAYDFSQATAANKPRLKKAANGINGHNVLRFDGTDDYMESSANSSSIIAAGADTIWVVFKIFKLETNSSYAYYNDTAVALGSMRGIVFKTSVGEVSFVDDGSDKIVYKTISTSTPYITRSRHASSTLYLSLNGDTEESIAAGNVGYLESCPTLATDITTLMHTRIDLAEVIIFNSALSAGNMAIVDTYLKAKYATY